MLDKRRHLGEEEAAIVSKHSHACSKRKGNKNENGTKSTTETNSISSPGRKGQLELNKEKCGTIRK